jgi:excisionase family DNA binding protein
MPKILSKNLLTLEELADLLNVSRSFLYKKTASRSIPHFRIGKRVLFDGDEVEAWLQETARRDVVR